MPAERRPASAAGTRIVLAEPDWSARADAHARRVRPWTEDRLARRSVGRPHAVWDFLFDYYPYSPAKLATWHPGVGVVLAGPSAHAYLRHPGYREHDDGVSVEVEVSESRRIRLETAVTILRATASRTPMTGCFALHEWAMAYRLTQAEVRHSTLALRVSPQQIVETVDDLGLRCTHLDAYRFFTAAATPLNQHRPTRAGQAEQEQPGCLHAAMDLYKYAFWFAPLVGSDLVADCFENAARARELDMRASPYDVTGFGLEPICVETAAGRREYAAQQRALMDVTAPLRERLLSVLRTLARDHDGQASATADPTFTESRAL